MIKLHVHVQFFRIQEGFLGLWTESRATPPFPRLFSPTPFFPAPFPFLRTSTSWTLIRRSAHVGLNCV